MMLPTGFYNRYGRHHDFPPCFWTFCQLLRSWIWLPRLGRLLPLHTTRANKQLSERTLLLQSARHWTAATLLRNWFCGIVFRYTNGILINSRRGLFLLDKDILALPILLPRHAGNEFGILDANFPSPQKELHQSAVWDQDKVETIMINFIYLSKSGS